MKKGILLIVLLIGAAIALAGCKENVLVGVVLPLSGGHQVYGESSRAGLELAMSELRAAGESRIELKVVDSGSDPEKARELLAQLYRDGALAAVGGLTLSEAEAMAPVAEDAERVLLSPSAAIADQPADARYFFSLAPTDHVTGTTMASFAARELGVESAVVIRQPEMAAEALVDGFRTTLATQGGRLAASLDASGAAAEKIAEALGHRPDALYVAADEATAGELVRELRGRGFTGEILTTQAFACADSIGRLGDAAAHVLLTQTVFLPQDGDPRVARFVERFSAATGAAPDVFAAEAYDALRVLAAALDGRPALPSEVRKGLLHTVKDFPGVTGTIRFDETRGVPRIPRVYSVSEELTLRDHSRWLQAERDRRERDEAALLKRLGEIREAMADHGSS